MGDGTRENPFTREDVLRRIRRNGGTAEGLDFTGNWFQDAINLSKLELNGVILKGAHLPTNFSNGKFTGANLVDTDLWNSNLSAASMDSANFKGANFYNANLAGAYLYGADFEEADLWDANLQGALLRGARFKKADLWRAKFRGADLVWANLDTGDFGDACLGGANLAGVKFTSDAKLEDVNWGDFILGEETGSLFYEAAETYRRLKIWYTEHGIYDVAGEFYFREMTVRRKLMKWWPNPLIRSFYKMVSMLCGYGERLKRIFISAAVVILGMALIYFLVGSLWSWGAFGHSLYFSSVSFTALGYGSWVNVDSAVIKGLGAAESFLGVFMMALFLVTFTRKMTR